MSNVWTTRDGREIPIDEMTDDHLANTISYLLKEAKRRGHDLFETFSLGLGSPWDDPVFWDGGDCWDPPVSWGAPWPPMVPKGLFSEMVAEGRSREGEVRRVAEDSWDQVHCRGWDDLPWEERRRMYHETTRKAVPGRDSGSPVPYPTKDSVRRFYADHPE